MSDQLDLDRVVTDWLRADVPARAPQGVLSSALDRAAVQRQDRALPWDRLGSRPVEAHRLRRALVLVTLAAALVGAAVGVGALLRQPPNPFPRGNGWIAYSQHVGVNADFPGSDDARNMPYLLNIVREGADPVWVAGAGGADPVRAACPSFSPDGTRLAYAEAADPLGIINNSWVWGTRTVVVREMAAGGPGATAVRIPVSTAGSDPCPTWSSDGQVLTFPTGDPIECWMIPRPTAATQPSDARVIGSGDISDSWRDVWNNPGARWTGHISECALSPDGSALAIASSDGLFLVPTAGGEPRAVGQGARDIAWAPDGSWIAAGDPFAERGGVVVIPVHGANADLARAAVNLGPGYTPAWSPDGSRIAFERFIDPETSASEIVVANPDGSEPHVIVLGSLGRDATTTYAVGGVSWSPDGSRLLFAGHSNETGTRLISVSASGDPSPKVFGTDAPRGISDMGVSWQPVTP